MTNKMIEQLIQELTTEPPTLDIYLEAETELDFSDEPEEQTTY